MTIYAFRGRNTEGRLVNGQVDANSLDAAASQLLGRGVTPLALDEQKITQSLSERWQEMTNTGRVKTVEIGRAHV